MSASASVFGKNLVVAVDALGSGGLLRGERADQHHRRTARREEERLLVGVPSVLIVGLGVVQLARDVLAQFRERTAPVEIRLLIIRGEAR
jgi:hypothetical protein